MTDTELAAQPAIARLEAFMDEVLKADLKRAMARRDEAFERASQCHRLRRLLKDLVVLPQLERSEPGAPSKGGRQKVATPDADAELRNDVERDMAAPIPTSLRVDLGGFVFATAEVPDARVVHVNVGCGVVVPMTHSEAERFLLRKEQSPKDDVGRCNKEILRVKFRIRLVMESIRRLHEGYVADATSRPS